MAGVISDASSVGTDRVIERRRAVALAHHYRESEGLSITQIADRLGRSPATIKAYFYGPSDANKRPTGGAGRSRRVIGPLYRASRSSSWEREVKAGGRELRSHLPAAAPRGEILPGRTISLALGLAVQHLR